MNNNSKNNTNNNESEITCGYITKKGTPCKNRPEDGHKYCKLHIVHEDEKVSEVKNSETSDMGFLMDSIYSYDKNENFLHKEEENFQNSFEEGVQHPLSIIGEVDNPELMAEFLKYEAEQNKAEKEESEIFLEENKDNLDNRMEEIKEEIDDNFFKETSTEGISEELFEENKEFDFSSEEKNEMLFEKNENITDDLIFGNIEEKNRDFFADIIEKKEELFSEDIEEKNKENTIFETIQNNEENSSLKEEDLLVEKEIENLEELPEEILEPTIDKSSLEIDSITLNNAEMESLMGITEKEEKPVIKEEVVEKNSIDEELGIDFDKVMKELKEEEENVKQEEIIGEKDKIMEQEKNKNIIDDEDDIPILLDEIQEEAEEKAKKHDDMDDLSDLLGNIDENSDISQVIGSDDSERVKNLFDEDILEELDLPPKGKKESEKSKKKEKKEPSKLIANIKYGLIKYKYKIFIIIIGMAIIGIIAAMYTPFQVVPNSKLSKEVVNGVKDVEVSENALKNKPNEIKVKEEPVKVPESKVVENSNENKEKAVVEKPNENVETKGTKEVNKEKIADTNNNEKTKLTQELEREIGLLNSAVNEKDKKEIQGKIEAFSKQIKMIEDKENNEKADKIKEGIDSIVLNSNVDIVKTNSVNAIVVLKMERKNESQVVSNEKMDRDLYKIIENIFENYEDINNVNINVINENGRGKVAEITAKRYEYEKIQKVNQSYSILLSNFKLIKR